MRSIFPPRKNELTGCPIHQVLKLLEFGLAGHLSRLQRGTWCHGISATLTCHGDTTEIASGQIGRPTVPTPRSLRSCTTCTTSYNLDRPSKLTRHSFEVDQLLRSPGGCDRCQLETGQLWLHFPFGQKSVQVNQGFAHGSVFLKQQTTFLRSHQAFDTRSKWFDRCFEIPQRHGIWCHFFRLTRVGNDLWSVSVKLCIVHCALIVRLSL